MMRKQLSWLAPDCVVEPLVDSWHAWAYLVPPLQAGMMIRSRHIPVMESFVSAPDLHVEALKNPDLIGGPYLSCSPENVGRVESLLESTRKSSKPLLDLAEAYVQLEDELRRVPNSMSLEPLYVSVPDPIKGYVELVYDRWHQPHARILEALLYRSENFERTRQSVTLERMDFDRREFVFSTPRFPSDTPTRKQVRLNAPFDEKALELLFRSRTQGQELGLLIETLARFVDGDVAALEAMFVSKEPARVPKKDMAGAMAVRYFGHACVLIEGDGFSVLIDPLIPGQGSGPQRFSHADLPDRVDYVLLTHTHQDHVVLESLLELRHRVGTFGLFVESRGSMKAKCAAPGTPLAARDRFDVSRDEGRARRRFVRREAVMRPGQTASEDQEPRSA